MTIRPGDKLDFLVAAGTGSVLTGTELKVLLHVVACLDNHTGLARIGLARLAERSGVHRATVLRALDRLAELGILPVAVRGGAARDGGRAANVYRPNLTFAAPTSSTGATGSVGDTDSMDAVDQSHGCNGLVAPMQPLPSSSPGGFPEGEEEVSASHAAVSAKAPPARGGRAVAAASNGEPQGFSEFWAACPKQVKRAEARKEYQRIVAEGRATPATLITAMRQYADAVAHVGDPRWVKHAHTWLEEQRWEDNPQPPRPKEPKQPKGTNKVAKPPAAKQPKPKKGSAKRKADPTPATRRTPTTAVSAAPAARPASASAPATLAPRHKCPYSVGDRVEHASTGRTGAVTGTDDIGSTVTVRWDGFGAPEQLVFHNLKHTTLTAEQGAERNQTIDERKRRHRIGTSLKGKREYRRLTVAEVASSASVTAHALTAIETGTYEGADFDSIVSRVEGAIRHY